MQRLFAMGKRIKFRGYHVMKITFAPMDVELETSHIDPV